MKAMLKPGLLSLWCLGAALTAAGCAVPGAVIRAEVAHTNTQTVLAFEETVFNKHQVKEGFERYVGPSYKQHDPLLADGRDGAIKALSYVMSKMFPNSRVVVKRTVAQDDLVAAHVFWNQKPGETRGVAMVDIYRLENGKIVERWGVVQDVPEKAASDNPMF
jgi:predicted SnoaL-like aldol condensation-catalyzing enzyme